MSDLYGTGMGGTYAVPSTGASALTGNVGAGGGDRSDVGIGFIPGLDGYRGLAITLVIVLHTMRVPKAETVMSIGWIGVNLFFVLSGFLITSILLEAKGSAHYFKHFYARRALRILPLYYAALAAVFFVLPLVVPHSAS